MKMKSLALTLALFTGAAVSLAQAPQMGTWKLNEAKSKIPAGVIKNVTVIYAMDGDKIKVTTEGIDPSGAPMHTEWTGKFDGKPYPLTGDSTADSRTYTLVDDHNLKLTNKMGDKVSNQGTIAVSADGKSRTLKTTSADASGKMVSATSVYDKQPSTRAFRRKK